MGKPNKHADLLLKVLSYFLASMFVIIIEIILYEYMKEIFPSETTFLGLPFNTPTFVFAMLFVFQTIILYTIFFYFPSVKKKAKILERRGRLG